MTYNNYDAIIIGAGSVGIPTAMELAYNKLKVLVLEKEASPGQGQNKAAIGGVRATFSDPGKIQTCLQSLEIVSKWQENYGDDIGWIQGGYCFPVYTPAMEKQLKDLLVTQHKYGLNIDWIPAERVKELIPGINPYGKKGEELLGGTYSPEDGNLSPLKTMNAFYSRAARLGAEFRFNETVMKINIDKNKIKGVITDKGSYNSSVVIIASGADARDVGMTANLDIPVFPDCHEAGITEPVERFFSPLVVDLRERPGSKNFYFYQNYDYKIIFCLTPEPPIWGKDRVSTSDYLPQVSRRLIEFLPRLKNIRVRRIWRGLYPMTPDGIPIVDKVKEIEGLYLTVGLCGQGLMLGPGIALNMASLILKGKPVISREVFREFSLYRNFRSTVELLK